MNKARFAKFNNVASFIRITVFNIANNQQWMNMLELECMGASIYPQFPGISPTKMIKIDTRSPNYAVEIKWETDPYFSITVGGKGTYRIPLREIVKAKLHVPEGFRVGVSSFNFNTDRLEDREHQLIINDDFHAEYIPVEGVITGVGFRNYDHVDQLPNKAAEGTHLKLVVDNSRAVIDHVADAPKGIA